jgi:hypothetical protein
MSTNFTIDPSNPLSPSELVLLNGDKFAKKVMLGNVKLMHTDASVSTSQLGMAILVSAVLADETAGNLKLEIRQEKAMFGLRKVKNLYADPTPHSVNWPQYCLETQLPEIAERFKAEEDNLVSNLIYAWLREDSGSPWATAIELVKSGLAYRGLLDKHEEKKLKILTVTSYSLPESTADLAAQYSTDSIQQMIDNCERYRKEVWKLLEKQIKSAIKARTEQDDMDMDFD